SPLQHSSLSLHDALPIFGQFFCAPSHDGPEVFFLERTAEPIAVEARFGALEICAHGTEILARFTSQILILGTLNDAVERLIGARSEEHTSELQSRFDIVF